MSVNVIIVNWNSGRLLETSLQHLYAQTIIPDRIIVVDNASSDGSCPVPDKTGRLKIINLTENTGFASGNNLGLAECDSQFIALINPDVFVSPDWIEKMLQAAVKYPEVAAFGSRQLSYGNSQILDGTGDKYHLSGLVWRERKGKPQNSQDMRDCEIFSPCAAAAFYRREAVIEVGGFDSDYFCYVEDVDLGFRLRLAGHKAMYIPEAIVQHVGSATTGGQHSDFSLYHGHRNIIWTFIKNMPSYLFWAFLPAHIALNVFSIVWFSLQGKHKVILRAKLDAVRGLGKMLRKRTSIQKHRIAKASDIARLIDKRLIPLDRLRCGAKTGTQGSSPLV